MRSRTDGSVLRLWGLESGLGKAGPRGRVSPRRDAGLGKAGLRVMWLPICASLLALILACPSLGAETPSEPPKTTVDPPSQVRIIDGPNESSFRPEGAPSATSFLPPTGAPAFRDPTQPGEQMRAILGQQRVAQAPAAQVKLPMLRIKGRVASADGHVLVLLQVGQATERVTTDTEWTTEDGLTVSVVSASLTELRLLVQPLNRTITIR